MTAAEDINAFAEGNAKAYPKLGLLSLVAYVRKYLERPERVEFEYHDMLLEHLDTEDLSEIIRRFQPDVVGISCLSYSEDYFHAVAKAVKETRPEALVIGGGPYVSSLREAVLHDENVDLLVYDEGEVTFCELLKCLLEGRDYTHVAGTALRLDGQVRTTPARTLIENLDDLPIPAFDLVNFEA
jgi:anaerobic magnesium-protoporphyrin IX monomethyl ester cyclase